jgi:hypothetical protein
LPQPVTNSHLDIAAGQSVSDNSVDISGAISIFLVTPDDWDRANITFLFSIDNNTFSDLFDEDGNELILAIRKSTIIPLSVTRMPYQGWLKIRSGTRFYPVVQSADRKFTVQIVVMP